jgi:hypothetical protein
LVLPDDFVLPSCPAATVIEITRPPDPSTSSADLLGEISAAIVSAHQLSGCDDRSKRLLIKYNKLNFFIYLDFLNLKELKAVLYNKK